MTETCELKSDRNNDINYFCILKVKFIFSDKTGTLTRNIMELKRMTIAGKMYRYDYNPVLNIITLVKELSFMLVLMYWPINHFEEWEFECVDQFKSDQLLLTSLPSWKAVEWKVFRHIYVCHWFFFFNLFLFLKCSLYEDHNEGELNQDLKKDLNNPVWIFFFLISWILISGRFYSPAYK